MPLSFGGLAVDLFFVLSGYCIHRKNAYLLAKNPKSKLSKRKYLNRRIFRIYPVYIAALCLTAVIHVYVAAREPSLVSGQNNSLFAFVASLLSLQGIVASSFAHNTVFWTLAIEIHFLLDLSDYLLDFFKKRCFICSGSNDFFQLFLFSHGFMA
ncbi:acyltransferase [Acaryochloris sp. 'Moss Beach']|uniref:acyltransferase family protein n=1 Tax=Acaryochloris sp. 'Moss Beach' TaxID=2740837 RepID=UPI0037BFAFF9|nr:acyltransferase [Acaryochloris sp. 'Moss Beach']